MLIRYCYCRQTFLPHQGIEILFNDEVVEPHGDLTFAEGSAASLQAPLILKYRRRKSKSGS